MANFSKADHSAAKAALKKRFGFSKEVCETKTITDMINDAPITVVEYDGFLPRESSKQRDRRMEVHSVYSGDISQLVGVLRNSYNEEEGKTLAKWELILTRYFEIMDVQKVLTRARTEAAFGDDQATDEVLHTEELPTNQSSSMEDVEEHHEESTPITEVAPMVPVEEDNTPTAEDSEASRIEAAREEPIKEEASTSEPIGLVNADPAQSLSINKSNNTEELKMEEFMKAAQAANPETSNPGDVAKTTAAAKPAKTAISDEVKQQVVDALADSRVQRDEYAKAHQVEGVIAPQKPNALRVKSNTGKTLKPDVYAKPEEAAKSIKEKVQSLAAKLSGRSNITIEQFETLSDEDKFFAVKADTDKDAVMKAKQIWELGKKAMATPEAEFEAYIPAADQISYPIKGVRLNGKALTMDELVVEMLNVTNGALYGVDSCDAEGKAVGEHPTTFKLQVVTNSKNAASNTISATKQATKSLAVRIANKKQFVNGGARVNYLFTETNGEAQASFKAAIRDTAGNVKPATVICYKCKEDENGNLQKLLHEKQPTKPAKGQTEIAVRYQTQPASWNVSIPVDKVVKEFAGEYKISEDVAQDAARWGIALTIKGEKGQIIGASSVVATVGFAAFAALLTGDVTLTAKQASSDTVKKLRAVADKAAEQAAAETAEGLE